MLHDPTLTSSVLRPTYVEVDLDVISANLQSIFAKAAGSKVLIVLKANAYGHGLIRIARHLEAQSVDYFGVAYLEEGIMLRESGINTPILVMGGIVGEQVPEFIKHNLTITASSVDKIRDIERVALKMKTRARVHLKVDTGMERIGTHYYSSISLLEAAEKSNSIDVEGIYTHYANADAEQLAHTRIQGDRFEKVLQFYDHSRSKPPLIHASNSGAFLQIKDGFSNMVRVGILLYGVYPSPHLRQFIDLSPALSWKSKVVFFKVVKPGHPVSYGGTWSSEKLTRIVTCPVGYGDGYMRILSNRAEVIIRGNRYPIVGNICMDQFMVNIGWETSYNNDEVVLIGEQGMNRIRVEEVADWANTIPYEILTNINTRVPRVYRHSGDT